MELPSSFTNLEKSLGLASEMEDFMSPIDPKLAEKKLRLASDLFQLAFDVKRFQLRQAHPQLSEREINHRAYALIEKGCQ